MTSVDEFLRRVITVINSNDPVARALTLRVLGAIADLGDGSGLRLRLLLGSILLRVGRGSVVLIKGLDVLGKKC